MLCERSTTKLQTRNGTDRLTDRLTDQHITLVAINETANMSAIDSKK